MHVNNAKLWLCLQKCAGFMGLFELELGSTCSLCSIYKHYEVYNGSSACADLLEVYPPPPGAGLTPFLLAKLQLPTPYTATDHVLLADLADGAGRFNVQ